MSREDWIILRMLMVGIDKTPSLAYDGTFVRALMDLIKRRGADTVNAAIDQLHLEKAK